MSKTFHFLAGLPRTGSTLISAILNQNPQIYASPQTDLLQLMYELQRKIPQLESYRAGLRHEGYDNLLRSMGETFYADVDEPIIIDKNRGWGTPYNLKVATILNPDVRIIATVRPILEILASFVTLARANPGDNFIDRAMVNTDFYAYGYRDIDEARCDWLMMANGEIDRALYGVLQAKVFPEKFHLVTYDDLATDPSRVMAGIYSFLDLDPWNHDFGHVDAVDTHDDAGTFGMPTLHHIRATVARQSVRPEDVLSDYVLQKYANADDILNVT